RILGAAVELGHDPDGIVWPPAIAPYHAVVLALGAEPAIVEAAERAAAELDAAGLDVLLDDRDERPGVKFKDADLVGLPLCVALGARSLAAGGAEGKLRREPTPTPVPLAELRARAETLRADWGLQP